MTNMVVNSSQVFGPSGSVIIPTWSFYTPFSASGVYERNLRSGGGIQAVHDVQGKSSRNFLYNDFLRACTPLEACSRNYSSRSTKADERKAPRLLLKNPLASNLSFVTTIGTSSMRFWRSCQVKSGEMEGNPSNELILDEQSIQQDLERAIKEENYPLAAKLRDDLRLINQDSRSSLLSANSRFYNAFRNGDFVEMRSIWAKGDNVCCVHPGAGTISGYDLVMSSWEIICGSEHEFPIMIDLRDVNVHVRGEVGYVTCLEVVKTKGGSWGRQVATNVFERIEGKWLMCIHHASHVDM